MIYLYLLPKIHYNKTIKYRNWMHFFNFSAFLSKFERFQITTLTEFWLHAIYLLTSFLNINKRFGRHNFNIWETQNIKRTDYLLCSILNIAGILLWIRFFYFVVTLLSSSRRNVPCPCLRVSKFGSVCRLACVSAAMAHFCANQLQLTAIFAD